MVTQIAAQLSTASGYALWVLLPILGVLVLVWLVLALLKALGKQVPLPRFLRKA